MNNVPFIIISIAALFFILNNVRKKSFSIKESFWWVIAAVVMLLLSIFPYSIDWVAQQLHIAYPPSLLFVLCFVFLIFIIYRNSKKISDLHTKVIDLSQELAILKAKNKKPIPPEKKIK